MNVDVRDWFAGYYNFPDFAVATGLKAPVISQAYNDFRNFTICLQKEEGNNYYGYDGIISKAFERWEKQQTFYILD